MSYDFDFDLSKLSQNLFRDIAKLTQRGRVHEKMGYMARNIVEKFNVDKITGMPVRDSITIIEDLIDVQTKNNLAKKQFLETKNRALFLPHCCRKYMDSQCKAVFNAETASYTCAHCSEDCIVNQATRLAKKERYDVHILPGGSCVKKIFKKKSYDGVIGVACTEELKLALKMLNKSNVCVQAIPLIKNGCSGTRFNLDMLRTVITPEYQ